MTLPNGLYTLKVNSFAQVYDPSHKGHNEIVTLGDKKTHIRLG